MYIQLALRLKTVGFAPDIESYQEFFISICLTMYVEAKFCCAAFYIVYCEFKNSTYMYYYIRWYTFG
jgi:hypothetical protein